MSRIPRSTALVLVMAAILFLGAGTAGAQLKIGFIRSDYIFANYEPYKEAQKELEGYQKTEFDKLQALREDLEKKAQDAQSKEMLMTPEMKQSKLEELNQQQQDLSQRYEELVDPDVGLLAKKQTELMQPIIDRINEVLMRVAEEENYDLIFDATPSATGNPLLFANEKYDITDKIIEEIKKEVTGK